MAITTSISLSLSLSSPDCLSKLQNPMPSSSLIRPLSLSLSPINGRRAIFIHNPFHKTPNPFRRVHAIAAPTEAPPPPEAAAVETAQQIVSGGDDGAATVISALLFAAFVGLSILTIGVIYIAVTDFLQKREKEKFEREEEAAGKKKSGKKKKKSRARAGPRGFGQKIDDETGDDD